jgi:hydroxymethylglutaryl-CoA lyase
MIKFVECPRDAMQGLPILIPTDEKIRYIQSLLDVGFDVIDFGSFVSPRVIPQMADTVDVLNGLDLSTTKSKLLAIVANTKGAMEACKYPQIDYLGYPFSISETFQQKNTNSSIAESYGRVQEIASLCQASGKELVIYFSMGFGNPYGDPFDASVISEWTQKIAPLGVKTFSLSDTVGIANPETIREIFFNAINEFKDLEFGAHLHSAPYNWLPKVKAAYKAGCKRFDVAIGGLGGCPLAKDDLVGNLATEYFVNFFRESFKPDFNEKAFENSLRIANEIFHMNKT